MSRSVDVVVFDLDGVIRHWDDEALDAIEESCGLPARTILDTGFSEDLGPACMTGRLTYREWMDEIRHRVLAAHGEGALPALDAWERNVGVVDPEAVDLVRRVRVDATVALLSNGTTRLRRDLHVLGIDTEFDHIFNTAELGVAKPAVEAFAIVCDTLGVAPHRAAFVDDLADNVDGARVAGLHAHLHTDLVSTARFLGALLSR